VLARSFLYVPGNSAAKLESCGRRGADALIVDLEDAVPDEGKAQAREAVASWLAGGGPGAERNVDVPEVWVRVNSGVTGLHDLEAVFGPGLCGLVVAKTESADELAAFVDAVALAERAAGLPDGSVAVVPLLESARALLSAVHIAAVPRVARLQVGEADLAADLGMSPSDDDREWDAIRTQVVVVSAAAGIDPPVAPVSTNFRDLESFATTTRALARRGYVGRACIHPAQVAVANEVFTPAPEELERARALIRDFEEASVQGRGVVTGPDGRMVDEAVVRRARRLVELAR
jgi:citrate lyase subunit beta/citryl-CoA lyase